MTNTLDSLRNQAAAGTQVATAVSAKPKTMNEIAVLPRSRQFPAMLESFKREIALALPAHLTPERMARLAMTAFSQNKDLAACDPKSVFAAVILSSQLGLEIGVDGQAYLVPYKGRATFVPGWKGYVELINRAGRAGVWTGAVFEGDKFEYAQGDSPFVKHQPTGKTDESKDNLLYVYAIGRVKGMDWPVIEVWPKDKVIRHLIRFNKVGPKHYALKDDTNFIAYGRKVALLQVIKYMPKSVELRAAESLDGRGTASIDLKDVLEGEWSNVSADANEAEDDDTGTTGNDQGSAGAEAQTEEAGESGDKAQTAGKPAPAAKQAGRAAKTPSKKPAVEPEPEPAKGKDAALDLE